MVCPSHGRRGHLNPTGWPARVLFNESRDLSTFSRPRLLCSASVHEIFVVKEAMEQHLPRRTAQGAAMHRAAHQLLDRPPVFADPLALSIIGTEAVADLRAGRDWSGDARPGLRAFVAARS